MLVLSRKKHEKILIRDDIEIVVVEIKGDKVRLGIKAPNSVAVHREEVFLAIKREKERAEAAKAAEAAEAVGTV